MEKGQEISIPMKKATWASLAGMGSAYAIWVAMSSYYPGEMDDEDLCDMLIEQYCDLHYQILETQVRIVEAEVDAAAYEQVIGCTLRWIPTGGRDGQPVR